MSTLHTREKGKGPKLIFLCNLWIEMYLTHLNWKLGMSPYLCHVLALFFFIRLQSDRPKLRGILADPQATPILSSLQPQKPIQQFGLSLSLLWADQANTSHVWDWNGPSWGLLGKIPAAAGTRSWFTAEGDRRLRQETDISSFHIRLISIHSCRGTSGR